MMRPWMSTLATSLLLLFLYPSNFIDANPRIDKCLSGQPNDVYSGGHKYNCYSLNVDRVPKQMIPVQENTTWINLANNDIEVIPVTLFGRGPYGRRTSIVGIELQNNHIQIIPDGMFDSLTNIRYLNLNNNPIFAIYPTFFYAIHDMADLTVETILLPTDSPLSCAARQLNFKVWVDCPSCAGGLKFLRDSNDVDCCVGESQSLCFTPNPTSSPSQPPTAIPSRSPSVPPTRLPSQSPTTSPTRFPTMSLPTHHPSVSPTPHPSTSPTRYPTISMPTVHPTTNPPTFAPTVTTVAPTVAPTQSSPTISPSTSAPTEPGDTLSPTFGPVFSAPTAGPTVSPTTSSPTVRPTFSMSPTSIPTGVPTSATPTLGPSGIPTAIPTQSPTRTTLFPISLAAGLDLPCLVDQILDMNQTTSIEAIAAMVDGARAGSIDVVDTFLKRSEAEGDFAQMLESNINGITALAAAAEAGRLNVVEYLIERGANPLNTPSGSMSPLWAAASTGHVDIVDLLINQQGVIVTLERTVDGLSPLRIAAANGHADVVQELLGHGASVNGAMDVAVSNNRVSVLKILNDIEQPGSLQAYNYLRQAISRGFANTTAFFLDRVFPHATELLALSLQGNRSDIAAMLIPQVLDEDVVKICTDQTDVYFAEILFGLARADLLVDVCAINSNLLSRSDPVSTDSLLCTAVIHGHESSAIKFFNEGPAMIRTSPCVGAAGAIPFDIAAKNGMASLVALFVESFAPYVLPVLSSCGGNTNAVLVALQSGFDDLVIDLVSSGYACLPTPSSNPLFLASRNGNIRVLNMTLLRGDDINAANASNVSPLFASVAHGHVDAFHVLVANGADVSEYRELLRVASANGDSVMVDALVAMWFNPDLNNTTIQDGSLYYDSSTINEALLGAVESGSVSLVSTMTSSPLNANINYNNGVDSPLFLATEFGHLELVVMLLKQNVDAFNSTWRSPSALSLMDTAAVFGHKDIARELLAYGVPIDARYSEVIRFDPTQSCITSTPEATVVESNTTTLMPGKTSGTDTLGLGIGLKGEHLVIIIAVVVILIVIFVIWRVKRHKSTLDKLGEEEHVEDFQDITHLATLRYDGSLPEPMPVEQKSVNHVHHQRPVSQNSVSRSPESPSKERVRSGYEQLAVQHRTNADAWMVDSINPDALFQDLDKDRERGPYFMKMSEPGTTSNWDMQSGDLGVPMAHSSV